MVGSSPATTGLRPKTLLIRSRIEMHKDSTNGPTSNEAGGLIEVEPRRCSWIEGLTTSQRRFSQQLEPSTQDVAGYSELRVGRLIRSENAAFVKWPKLLGIIVCPPSLLIRFCLTIAALVVINTDPQCLLDPDSRTSFGRETSKLSPNRIQDLLIADQASVVC